MGGQDDDHRRQGQPFHFRHDLQTVYTLHLEVQQDQINGLLLQQGQRLLSTGSGRHLVSRLAEGLAQEEADGRLVVHDQDVPLHTLYP